MAARYDKLVPALKSALPDAMLDALGRDVSFIRRLRDVTAPLFVWAVVMSRFAPGLPGFKTAGDWFARLGGKLLWRCPFQKRFKTPRTVELFAQAFERISSRWRAPREHIRQPNRSDWSVVRDAPSCHERSRVSRSFSEPCSRDAPEARAYSASSSRESSTYRPPHKPVEETAFTSSSDYWPLKGSRMAQNMLTPPGARPPPRAARRPCDRRRARR